ncbi:CDK5 regulatory subunit-associated protein 2 isoform X2 [Gouania willdenowi]|uniref:CDK5 regulatory subunit-associated protein 2 isoform X2 n=1 Tax=Gouania willdenowi TaxID=441366 RepID=UPI0010544479|nr:CDK5 regulatory subunit-associated protein 2-like isoform X2 [Gouania willdenowi]
MDSVVGDDLTLPVDINGSCRLPDGLNVGDFSTDNMTAPSFPDTMSPIKALTMKDYENQITALKTENFNLKLRIYFMEERMQQKCDDSTEDIFKTNIELKVELESMKRELAEKHELLISASKALESLASRESAEPQRVREQYQREMEAVKEALNKKIAVLQESLQKSEEEVEKMAAIAEQEKLKNINMEKQLQAVGPLQTFTSASVSSPVHELQQALEEKDSIIEQLRITLQNQDAVIQQKSRQDQKTDMPMVDCVRCLSDIIAKKDEQLEALTDELHKEKETPHLPHQSDDHLLETTNKMLTEELNQAKSINQNLTQNLEEFQTQNKTLSGKLEDKEGELNSEKKNALKRDKTIQGLTQVLREKEKEIAELCHEIEDRDDALTKAREAAHKAQLQKYQGVEEHQNLLMSKQSELAQLQGEHHNKVLEAQKLQRALDRKEQELADLQQAREQLEAELEDMQQQKKKGDKALNDLNNQLKKLTGEIGERESALEQQYQEMLEQTKKKLQAHEITIHRLTSTLSDKEQQLQEYINIIRDFEQSNSPNNNDGMLSKLRQRLKEKEKALEQALDEKFVAIEEKDNEIHALQLSLREKERDQERLHNLLSHNEETINNFNSLIKEKDTEMQHLENTLKNLQKAKKDVEDNLNRSLREKDSIISQLQLSLDGKTKDMEEMAASMLSQSHTHGRDLAEQMSQRLKATETMLAESVKAREALVKDNESAVEGLLASISSKDQLLKDSAEHYNRMLSERTQEIEELRRQLSDKQQQLASAEKQSSAAAQEGYLETAELRALLAEKDSLINKLVQRGQDRDQALAEMRKQTGPDQVLELQQTIQIMQQKLDEKEDELSRMNGKDSQENLNLPGKKTVVVLKKELAQKTEALNKALKRENELKMSLAELQSTLTELEGRSEGQAANIESLTATLKTKEEIIDVLHQRLGQRGDSRSQQDQDHSRDHILCAEMDGSLPVLPQRQITIIGGNSQQEGLPNLIALQQEHDALHKALRAEQQLYSNLVRTVKEQDSAQRLHALQLELTAVQLLRQQLEDGIKTNEELRDNLERDIHKAKKREGLDFIDPNEMESLRNQLEDAHRWNTSLQARLGEIQNRGGGVGGAKDGVDSFSLVGDQTSYLSICVEEGHDKSLSQLSVQELIQKVQELENYVSELQTLNNQLQSRLSLMEKDKDEWKQLEKMQVKQPADISNLDEATQTDVTHEQNGAEMFWENETFGQRGKNTIEKNPREEKVDVGSTSITHLREELLSLRSENAALRGLMKEQKSSMHKEKESADASGNSSEGQTEMRRSLETLFPQAKDTLMVAKQLKDNRDVKKSYEVPDGELPGTKTEEKRFLMARQKQSKNAKQQSTSERATFKSRLPVPVRLRVDSSSSSSQLVSSEQINSNEPQHQADVDESDQLLQSVTESLASHAPNCSTIDTNKVCEGQTLKTDPEPDLASLLTQLESLHRECQDKEALNQTLTQQLADWEELHEKLQVKDRLNRQYVEALQAAESTIAYLTACSLDSQGGLGSHVGPTPGYSDLQNRCAELQNALQEKEELKHQLLGLLSLAEKVLTSSCSERASPEITDLHLKIKDALQHVSNSSNTESSGRGLKATLSRHELQQQANSLQESLWKQNRLNAELQEQLRSTETSIKQTSFKEKEPNVHQLTEGFNSDLNQEIITVVTNCFGATVGAISSLVSYCEKSCSPTSGRSSEVSSDLQITLDELQKAFQVKEQLQTTTLKQNRLPSVFLTDTGQNLLRHLSLLHKVITDHFQKDSELQPSVQEDRRHRVDDDAHKVTQDPRGLPPDVQAQLEALHKALREKKKTCKSLEEKLATALTNTPSPETARKAAEQDDKGVQVDLQDLGYETSAKSENDREESSSTDLELGVNPSHHSACSLPALLKHERANFSSTENLDSTSSTPYPSSPALSSAKVSLKSLQVFNEYGVSEDPLQLQGQVRELKVQLETQTKLILQMQSLLRKSSISSDLATGVSELPFTKDQCNTHKEEGLHENGSRTGLQQQGKKDEEKLPMKDKTSCLNVELQREKMLKNGEHSQQNRSSSTSPARLDSLVQSQARELSQLRQHIKESRRLGAQQRRQMEELTKAFRELLQAGEVDDDMGEMLKEHLEKSLNLSVKLEGRLDKGEPDLDNEDVSALELARRLAKELQEKNRLIQSLQNQIRDQTPSCHSDQFYSDMMSSSCHSSPTPQGFNLRDAPDWPEAGVPPMGGVQEEGEHSRGTVGRLQGLHRANGRLQQQLRSSEELNASLRCELDLHRSIMAQSSIHHQEQDQSHHQESSGCPMGEDRSVHVKMNTDEQRRSVNPDLLAEHLQEIRALRQRLEESISTNDRLREQLERKLAEVERDPTTNIFIHGKENQSQLEKQMRFLWGENQALKEKLNTASRDKQKENEKLREALTRRTAKLDHSRRECEALRTEKSRLQERLERTNQENTQLQEVLHDSKEELHRLQSDVKLQRQQLSDSQHLLQSLRVELQVHEKMKTDSNQAKEVREATSSPGSLDLSELLTEIRHLRLQLERSIQTNTALRQRLEEQLLRGSNRSETININYLLSSPDEGGRSLQEGCNPHRHSFHTRTEHDGKCLSHSEGDAASASSSSSDSISMPSRLVPGHRMWASRNGRHVLGLIEDYNALRKQISEGHKLSHSMDTQLQECLHTLAQQQSSDNKVMEQQDVKSLFCSFNTMQQVLEEASRLLKLVWRVSLPSGSTAGDSNNQQNEIFRLRRRLSQQEKMLSGAVKRLQSTNHLKEGMERVIIDHLSLTHGVLKKARGNLESSYCSLVGLRGQCGEPDQGGSSQWPVDDSETPLPSSQRVNTSLHDIY